MPPDQRTILFYLAAAAAVVLLLAGLMYLSGVGIVSVQHGKKAFACLVAAVAAAAVAYFLRPGPSRRY